MAAMFHIPHRASEVESKRRRVRAAYSEGGLSSTYEREFDELRSLNRQVMGEWFRIQRGLPPDARTPYC